MAQQIIDVGAAPNDGQGDPLRTAFQYTNSNFTELYDRVQTVPPTTLVGEDGDVPGMYAYDPIYFYYCFAAWDGSSEIWAQVTQVGNISTNQIVSGNSNVVITGAGGTITVGVGGASNIAVFATTGTSITGNVTSSGYFLGNGALLTGLPQTYANSNITAYAESGWSGNIIPATDAAYNLGSATNQWKSLYVSNTTIYLGNVPIGIGAENVLTVNGNAVLTNGSDANISTSGNVTVGAILTDGYYFANGSPFVATSSYGNANVVANLAALASNPISTSGTITAGNINITGGSLEWSNASIVQTSASDVSITGDGQVTVRSLDGTYQWTFDNAGNLTAPGNIGTSANVTANYFIGDGSQLTNLPSGGGLPIANGTSNFNIATANGNATVTATGTYTWTFGDDGLLTLPGGNVQLGNQYGAQAILAINEPFGVVSQGNVGYTVIQWIDDIGNTNALSAISINGPGGNTGDITVTTGGIGANANVWTFDTTGTLTLPQGGIVYETGIPGGALTGNAIALKPQGGTNADQQLLIYPTVGPNPDVNHLHLTSGNLYNTELFLGNDDLYVKLANTGDIVINSNDSAGNTAQWTFAADGTLTFPGTPRIDTDANNFEVQAAESVNFEANAVVNIYTDTSGNAYQWQFGDDGLLTLPNSAVVKDTAGNAVAFGLGAGLTNQNDYAVAIGPAAGNDTQGVAAVAIGSDAGQTSQGIQAIAIGTVAGANAQGGSAVAIGPGAGQASQGQFAVALGYGAGDTNQGNNSIIINATGATLDQTTANTFTVAPIRNDVANVGEVMFYNTSSKEITYGNTISVAGNITCGTLVGNVTGAGAGVPTISSTSNLVLSAVGNVVVTGGYLNMSGNISSTGNITGNYILGNGSQLTNLPAPTVTQDIASTGAMSIMLYDGNIKYNNYATVEPASGNITGGNVLTAGLISATGNITGGNVSVAGGVTFADATYQNTAWTGVANNYIALGNGAGGATQSQTAVAIGVNAGNVSQDYYTVAIGIGAGRDTQLAGAIAIGGEAGGNSQGTNSIAIGYRAGRVNQANNSIVLNSTGANLNNTTANTFTVAPIRNDVANVGEVMFYNTTSKEITYGNAISVTGNVTGGNLITSGNITGNTAGFAIGYRDMPQVSFTANATIAASDAGKHYYSTLSTANALTIANNTSVSWTVGTAITVVNRGTGNIIITQGSGVSLYLAGNSTPANRTVTTYGMATLLNVAANVWMINGTGVS